MSLKATPLILSFNGGEISPTLNSRVDLAQYSKGCRALENFVPLIEGGVKRMPGTIYVAEVKHSDKTTRLFPFNYSTDQAYMIELGEYYFRFYKDNAQIQTAYAAWGTGTAYSLGALVTNGGAYYRCLVAHTSGTFATDLAAGYWETTDGATDLAYEIPNPYAEANIPDIKVFQDATTMYLCHPSYVTRKLTRTADTTWTLSYHLAKIGAEMTITAISQAATAVVTALPVPSTLAEEDIVYLTGVSGMTEVNDIFFKVGTVVASKTAGVEMQITSITNANPAVVTYENVPVTLADGDKILIKNVNGMTEVNDIYFTVAGVVTGASGTSQLSGINSSAYGAYTSGGTAQEYTSGTFQLADINSTAYTAYTSGGTAQETKFGTSDNHPALGGFFEQRLVLASTNNNPQVISLSKTGDYEDFTLGADDDEAMEYTLVSKMIERIRWIVGEKMMLIGTTGGIWKLGATTNEEPLTPTNISAKKQNAIRVKNIDAINVSDAVFWVTQSGLSLRQALYSAEQDSYIAPDFTRIAKHITMGATQALSGITDMSFQSEPYPILWAVRADGQLLGFFYEPREEIFSWFRVKTAGSFESIAIISKDDSEDEIWVIVNRTISDVTVRYIEYFNPFNFFSQIMDSFFVHSGITWDGGDAKAITGITNANPAVVTSDSHGFSDDDLVRIYGVLGMTEVNQGLTKAYTVANKTSSTFELSGITSADWGAYTSGGYAVKVKKIITGLDHLEGEDVSIMLDGAIAPNETVASGQVTADWYGNLIHAGLPYTSILEPTYPHINTNQGSSKGKQKRINKLFISLYETRGGKYGENAVNLKSIPYGTGAQPTLFTGDKEIEFAGNWAAENSFQIVQDQPLPMTLLSILLHLNVSDE